MNIIASSEEQKLKLESDYQEMLSKHGLVDHMLIEKNKRIDDVTRWTFISLGNIFAYILAKKMCGKEYIGCYKDQKAYSYWDSGFIGPIYIYGTHTKKIMFLYSDALTEEYINTRFL